MLIDGLVVLGGVAAACAGWTLAWLLLGPTGVHDEPNRARIRPLLDRLRTDAAPDVSPEQLVRFVDGLLWSDRKGTPLVDALEIAADRVGEPFSALATQVTASVRLGIPASRALSLASDEAPPEAARLLRVLSILAGEWKAGLPSGRNQLESLREHLRARAEVRRRLNRELAGLRANVHVVTAAIPGLVVLAWFTSPTLLKPLFTDPTGRVLGLTALVLFVGMLVALRRLTRVNM